MDKQRCFLTRSSSRSGSATSPIRATPASPSSRLPMLPHWRRCGSSSPVHSPPVFLIGDCLQERASTYYHASSSLKLADALVRIGYTLPAPAPAPARAQGQLALLQAMSEGMTSARHEATEPDQ